MGFTQEQQAALDARGKVIVSASAGSGKTTVMIEKIIRLIQTGVGVNEILAVTFTKKAAAQMKEKLCKALIEGINAPDADKEKRAELKKQLSEVPSADISTIHSFCSKLIRAHFFKAGVDNSFRVIGGDDAEGTALKNEAIDQLFEEGYAEKEEKFSHLLSVYWRKKSDNALRKIFTSAYEKLRTRADYKEYLVRSCRYDEGVFDAICKDLHAVFVEKCRYYQGLLQAEQRYFEGIGAVAQTSLCTELNGFLTALIGTEEYFACREVEKPKFTVNRSSKKDDTEKLLHNKRLAFLKERVVKAYEDETAKLENREKELARFLASGKTASALAEYLLRFDEKYAALKAERGVLDYNDLEHKALALLSDAEIVAELREKYPFVFVDEYQDVNPVQEAIISALGGEELFLVGDVKQSIYGFRGSKSKFFAEKQKEFSARGTSLQMTRNFRSSDAVLDAVNKQFTLAMTPQVCAVDYANGSYMERGGRYGVGSGKVQIHFLGKPEKAQSKQRGVYSVSAASGGKEDELSVEAKTIRAIIEREKKSKWFDPDLGEYRAVNYSDIAVLSRKKQGKIAETVAALSAEGLPVTAAAAVNICDYSEVKTLIDILSLLDNAEQDIPLCSALLSAVGDLTTDELSKIRLAYKEERFFRNACKKYAEENADFIAYKLRKFYEYFDKLRARSRVLDAGELLTELLAETRMEARLLSRENGAACVKRIHRFIEETGSPEPLCVHGFLERLRDLEYKIEYSENGGEDSVKVLTMHSSKGLEYPVVIVDGLSMPFRGVDHDEVLIEEKYGLAPKAFDEQNLTKSSTLLRRLYEWEETESSVADELNLYYVALTRAKYGLHLLFEERVPMPDVKYAKSFAEFTDFSVWEEYVVEDGVLDLPKQERTALVFRPDEELAWGIMQAFSWKYPHTGAENLPVKSSATQLISDTVFGDGLATDGVADAGFGYEDAFADELFDEAVETPEKGTGKATGIAYHAFLERFDFSALYTEDGEKTDGARLLGIVEQELSAMRAKDGESVALLSAEKLVEILSNPVFYGLKDSTLYKEQQFLVGLPIKETYAKKQGVPAELSGLDEDEQMIFQGAIDLLAVGEEVRIIDYKYSKGNAEYLRKHYQPQLRLYRLATAKILGVDPDSVRCTIVNIYHGFEVEVD